MGGQTRSGSTGPDLEDGLAGHELLGDDASDAEHGQAAARRERGRGRGRGRGGVVGGLEGSRAVGRASERESSSSKKKGKKKRRTRC